jgi:hypothetical protein
MPVPCAFFCAFRVLLRPMYSARRVLSAGAPTYQRAAASLGGFFVAPGANRTTKTAVRAAPLRRAEIRREGSYDLPII